jgi:hypothetical protein
MVQPRTHRKSAYALECLPLMAKDAGQASAAAFAAKPEAERRAIINRTIAGTFRHIARRRGEPDPVILEAEVKPLPDGNGFVIVDQPMPPLRRLHGGDGRTLEDALREAKAARPRDHLYIANLKLAKIAERHRQELIKLGYTIEIEAQEPDPEPEANPSKATG